jgi:hypothetical protein
VISGIVHMLRCGARWRDCPEVAMHPRQDTFAKVRASKSVGFYDNIENHSDS